MTVHHHHHRLYFHQVRKAEAEQQRTSMEPHQIPPIIYNGDCSGSRKLKPTLLRLTFLFTLFSFTLAFLLLCSSSSVCPSLYSSGNENRLGIDSDISKNGEPLCSSLANNTLCCDRTAFRTDICFMRGDIRTHFSSNSIFLHSSANPSEERIKPYTRKWETSIMATIQELRLKMGPTNPCDVRHEFPAVVFSTGGYTGNVYHEFNDGIIPLFITSQHFNKQVVFVILNYHNWWVTKYADVLSRLSDYPPINFSKESRTHCFPEAIVGLRIHDDLTVDAAQTTNNKTIADFRRLLDEAYRPRIRSIELKEEEAERTRKPKLVIVSRNGSRAIENEGEVAAVAEEIGFKVEILRPERTMELAKIYLALNSSEAMIGVHGAAMTHFLFMRPGSVFIQIVPLGTDWAAETYYGEPAVKMGLWYLGYKILPKESSLHREYEEGDPVLRDPKSLTTKGWEITKRIYLDGQNVSLDLVRFRKQLERAHQYLVSKKGLAAAAAAAAS